MTAAVVVFDLDGTLVDSSQDINLALRTALGKVHGGRLSHEADEAALARGCHGLPLEVFFAGARPGAPAQALQDFVAAYRDHYYTHLLDTTLPFPGVVEGLCRLSAWRQRGRHGDLRTAIATTKMTATARRVVDELGLSGHFDLVLGSDGLPPKPDPAVLHAVFDRLGPSVGHSLPGGVRRGLMVGDTDHDMVAGRRAGLSTCAVGWSELPRERLAATCPDHHVSHFSEVVELALELMLASAAR